MHINNVFIDKVDHLYIVMSMFNLLECSDNYSITSRSLWNYYRDELNDIANENNPAGDYRLNTNKKTASKSFEYKTKVTGKASDIEYRLDAEVVFPLKYLNNFWRSLDLPLINYEIELDLSCSKDCVILEISRTAAIDANPNADLSVQAARAAEAKNATFKINSAKFYVPVATLSTNNHTIRI